MGRPANGSHTPRGDHAARRRLRPYQPIIRPSSSAIRRDVRAAVAATVTWRSPGPTRDRPRTGPAEHHPGRHARPPGRLRLLIGWAAVATTLPYVALKVAWIAGSTVGMSDAGAFTDPAYRVANTITLLLDAAVIGAALALTYPWGQRLPAWTVLLPAWSATGLLGTIALQSVATAPFILTDPSQLRGDALHGWVYALVYGSFSAQGLLLGAAFLLYVGDRWPHQIRRNAAPAGRISTRTAQVSAMACLLVACVYGYWAVGGTIGLNRSVATAPIARIGYAVQTALCLLTAFGVALLRRHRAGRPATLAVALVWIGGAAMVVWGLYAATLIIWQPSLGSTTVITVSMIKVAVGVVATVALSRALRSASVDTNRPGAPT